MKVTSKIGNALLLSHNTYISNHIPQTQHLTPANLLNMLQHYPSVYVKPNDSCRGKGIIRVDKVHPNEYVLRSRDTNTKSKHKNLKSLWTHIHRLKRNRMYVIQQGIQSITKTGHHFDIRVHMTRARSKWHVAGMIGNIARRGGIITTESSGGTCAYVHDVLQSHLGLTRSQVTKTLDKITSIAHHATKTISKKYPTWSEFGLDIGIDPHRNIWIFEINITPGALVFKKLDKQIFKRVLSLRKMAS